MKRSKFSKQQIAFTLRQAEEGILRAKFSRCRNMAATGIACAGASLRPEFMSGDLHGLPLLREHKAGIRPVKGRIGSVYGTVVIWADEHHIVQRIVAAAA